MFDYLIIGAGSAGSALAGRLSEDSRCRVGLLEAGPADSSPLIHCPAGVAVLAKTGGTNWAFDTVPQPGLNGRTGYQPRGKVLGGSSSINAMIYARGQRQDYDDWAAEGNVGWSFDEVLPYFKRAEHNERGADAFHGTGGPLNVMDLQRPNRFGPAFVEAGRQAGYPVNPDFNGATQEGVGLYQVTHRAGERFSAAKAYLAPARARPNLTVLTGAHTTRVLFEGRRAVGVEFIQAGQRRELRAGQEVLLCAGALQSPQILMLSGVGDGAHLQQHGITAVHHLPGVGRHLHDHPDVIQVVHAPHLKDLFGLSLSGALSALRGIFEWRAHRTGLLTTNFAEAGQRGLLHQRAHKLEAAHQALQVVWVGEKGGVDEGCGQRVGAGQLQAAAALGLQQADMARIAVAEHGVAAVVDDLADDEVELQVRSGLIRTAADEAAGLGKVSGQQARAAGAPLEDASHCAPCARQRQAEQIFQVRRMHDLDHVRVVMQVPADAGQVVQGRDAVLLQVGAVPHAREHEDLW